jgi:hypothetical protein
VRVLVCRVGNEPVVEDVLHPFNFTKHGLLDGRYIESLGLSNDLLLLCAEEKEGLEFNRSFIARAPTVPEDASFVIRRSPGLAEPGELGVHKLYGNFVVQQVRGDYPLEVDMTDANIRTCMELFALCKFCHKEPKAYPGAVYCGAACTAQAEASK